MNIRETVLSMVIIYSREAYRRVAFNSKVIYNMQQRAYAVYHSL